MRLARVLSIFVWALIVGASQFVFAGAPDADNDGVPDVLDNCTLHPNAPPFDCDTDLDGYGNICDGDFNQDHAVSSIDYSKSFFPDYSGPSLFPPDPPPPPSPCNGFDCTPTPGPGVTNKAGDGTNMDCSEDGPTGDWEDGSVNAADGALFVPQFNTGKPGPSGLACAGSSGCT